MKERLGAKHYGAQRQESVAVHTLNAEGLVRAELKRRDWTEADLAHRPKGDARKVASAVRLRAATTVTVRWIAERLHMGVPGYVHHLVYLEGNAKGKSYDNIKNRPVNDRNR